MSILSSIEDKAVRAWIEDQGKHAELGSLKAAAIEAFLAQQPDMGKLLKRDPEELGRVVGGFVTVMVAAANRKSGIVLEDTSCLGK